MFSRGYVEKVLHFDKLLYFEKNSVFKNILMFDHFQVGLGYGIK